MKIAAAQYIVEKIQTLSQWKNKQIQLFDELTKETPLLALLPEYGSMELVFTQENYLSLSLHQQILNMQEWKSEFLSFFERLSFEKNINIVTPSFPIIEENELYNRTWFISPKKGMLAYQDKLTPTPYERNTIGLKNKKKQMEIFQVQQANIGIQVCYDSEFPQLIQHYAQAKCMNLLLVPSCTDGLRGMTRVQNGAQARALENQMFVLVSSITCHVTGCELIENSQGYSACYAPPDTGFPENGILARCQIDESCWIIADLDFNQLDNVRSEGEVRNYLDSKSFYNEKLL
ncbi:nitrilase-related carbon-nitrogen hydrolase [Silvanigrella aquatica]|uniref:CN hydrolase domain-containing protein n=1 Tax=Silvanigrella aquatica TaxID=1915309 RepID=A0A1L4CX27_9BACT|nr:nitrilase-related carbon-nitrogen hydrolase [Silvanigrella aquatica]APJ02501.1 hypothetical protein AXG55_00540 [Silvanigrella aquatica]